MASAEEYAQWIVNNADKKGTPEFNTVAKAYEEAKAEEPVVSVLDIEAAFDKFMKRIESQIKDATITVQNRALLEQLGQTAAIYHAEKVLAENGKAE